MFKILFAIVFFAELVLAIAVITNICRFNKCVNNWNNIICANKMRVKNGLTDFYFLLQYFSKSVLKIKEVIQQKRNEYLSSFLKTAAIYCGIFILKGKYKKAVLAYQLVKEIYEGISEAET